MICNGVEMDPPPSSECGSERTTNIKHSALIELNARGFWIAGEKAFFGVMVFNPLAKRYRKPNLTK